MVTITCQRCHSPSWSTREAVLGSTEDTRPWMTSPRLRVTAMVKPTKAAMVVDGFVVFIGEVKETKGRTPQASTKRKCLECLT